MFKPQGLHRIFAMKNARERSRAHACHRGLWPRFGWPGSIVLLIVLAALCPAVTAETAPLFEDDFESEDAGSVWELTGDWRFRTNSPCLGDEFGYLSEETALVFDYAGECAYRSSRTGYATLRNDVLLPITAPAVSLRWWDFVGAELGHDFYFVQVSTDGGATWPHEVFRDSKDEDFWDEESVDLSAFVGQSIRIRFGFASDVSVANAGWYVDDVSIVGESLPEGVSALALQDARFKEGLTAADMTSGDPHPVVVEFRIVIDPPNPQPITVNHATVDGAAISGLDFVASSGLLTIPANTASFVVPLTIVDDLFFEQPEPFGLVINSPSANAHVSIATAAGIIQDNETLTYRYIEDFEGNQPGQFKWDPALLTVNTPVNGWRILDDSACIAPEPGYADGTRALAFNNGDPGCSYYTAGGVEGVIAMQSAVKISGIDALSAQVSFRHYLEIAFNNDAIEAIPTQAYVEASKNGGVPGSWHVLRRFGPTEPSQENYVLGWQEEVIDLKEFLASDAPLDPLDPPTLNVFNDEDVFVRFRFVQPAEDMPNTAAGWYIDDFRIGIALRPTAPVAVSKVSVQAPWAPDTPDLPDYEPKAATEGNLGSNKLSFPVRFKPVNAMPITIAYETVQLETAVDNTRGAVSTRERTIRRLASVCSGAPDGFEDPTDITDQWEGFPQNTFDGLGTHTTNCTAAEINSLFFSEYVEGSGNNKAIELFNGTANPIVLAEYDLELYPNGSAAPSDTFNLSTPGKPVLAANDVLVIADGGADAAVLAAADITNKVTAFNGNDALVLKRNGVVVDVIGVVGSDPGSEWGIGKVRHAATADVDFVSTTGTLTIRPGTDPDVTPVSIDILLIGDDQPEPAEEYFGLKLSYVTQNVYLVNELVTGVIYDDDVPSTFDLHLLGAPGVREVSESAGTVTFAVQLVPPRTVPIGVRYRTINGTALAGAGLDYVSAAGLLTFPANVSTVNLSLTILGDDLWEDSDPATVGVSDTEFFQIQLETDSPYAEGGKPFNIEIADDDVYTALPELKILDAAATEGSCATISAIEPCNGVDTGQTVYEAAFEVTLAPASAQTVTLKYATQDGAAVAGVDYEAASGTITFAPGDTSNKTIKVRVWADRAIEGDETFEVVLSNPQGDIDVKDSIGTGTIRDDDYAAMTFGANGSFVTRRDLAEEVSTNELLAGGASVNFNAAEFKSFNFDTLYGWDGNVLKKINLVTGIVSTIADRSADVDVAGGKTWSGLAWDHTNGRAYACETGGKIYEINLDDGALAGPPIVNTSRALVALAVHPTTGRIYAITYNNGVAGRLFVATPGKDDLVEIGLLGDLAPTGNGARWDCDFDDTGAVLYLNAYTADGWVTRAVNIEDASTTLVFSNPQVSSLALATPPAPSQVQWTNDLYFDSAAPTGTNLVPDASAWTGGDAGAVVSGVGDVNGDAFEDFVVAAPQANVLRGEVFLFFGGPGLEGGGLADIVLDYRNKDFDFNASFFDGTQGVLLRGEPGILSFGRSASGLDDMNGDGISELALGYTNASGTGGVFVVFGRRVWPGMVTSSDIGSPLFGSTIAGLDIPGAAAGDNFGFAVSGAGDFNGDGYADLVVGAPSAKSPDNVRPGACYVIYGSGSGIGANGLINLPALTKERGVILYGENDLDGFGGSVSGAGDVNGDGLGDIVIGAPLADFRLATQANPALSPSVDEGAAFVLYGHPDYGTQKGPLTIELKKLSNAVFSPPEAAHPDKLAFTNVLPPVGNLNTTITPENDLLNTLVGKLPGYRLRGLGGRLGTSVCGLGDINGNGLDDIGIGEPQYDGAADAHPHWGRCYLLYGDDGRGGVLTAQSVGDSVRGQILTGIDVGDGFGQAVAAPGDINGDGYMDAAFGAVNGTPGGFSGEVYILWGHSTLDSELMGVLSMRDLASNGGDSPLGRYIYNTQGGTDFAFGRSLGTAGDFNNDNVADLLIGRKDGAFVFYGQALDNSAKYKNRMRSGESDLPNLEEGGQVSTGIKVYRGIGELGGRGYSQPASRVRMRFTGGGTGADSKDVSTQSVTLWRKAAPDVVVGGGNPEDDNAWIPGGVHWDVLTDRENFTKSELEFYYRPEDVAGLDLQHVGVFRAKEFSDALGPYTTWFWLPFSHDPDRKVFTVTRIHPVPPPSNTPTPKEEVNGTYALVQADLQTYLGEEIRPVGLTRDQVYANGPTFTSGMAFWHSKEKKLYAVKAGAITVEWKNTEGRTVSVIQGKNEWPPESRNIYQTFVIGSPNVPMSNTGGAIEFQTVQFMSADNPNATISIDNGKNFSASISTGGDSATARALILLSNDANPERGDLYFQFMRVVKAQNPEYLLGGTAGVSWSIGTSIGRDTDSVYRQNHNEACGSPYLINDNCPYAPASERYPGFYDRATRTGTIVPVNLKKSTDSDMILTFYQKGRKLLAAKTGSPVRHPLTLLPLDVFDWPHVSRKYIPQWAPDDQVDKIIISKQNGTGELDPAVFGTEPDIYYQNDAAQKGFNPNEEHAFIAPYGAGVAAFALRNDLNGTDSSSYVLIAYGDPSDLTGAGVPRAKMKPYKVIAQTTEYPFGDWPGVTGKDDPYEGEAGAIILPPYPLSYLRISADNTFTGGPVWKDRNKSHWAIAATGPTEDEKINMRFYYPVQEGFHFPQAYRNAYSGTRDFVKANPDDVPWLDGGVSLTAPALPVKVQYVTTWPDVVPEMQLGDILIKAKKGLPTINGQCSVNLLYQESMAKDHLSSVDLIDPVVVRSVNLEEIPDDIKTGFQGQNLIFTDLPPALQFRLTYRSDTKKLSLKGIYIEPTAGDDYVLLNVLSSNDEAKLRALSPDTAWNQAVTDLANETTGAGAVVPIPERGYMTTLASAITASSSTVAVAAGRGASAPTPPFLLEVRDRYNPVANEIMKVTAVSGDIFTVTRAQKDTVARAFSANDKIQNYDPKDAPLTPPEVTALTTGNAQGTGYVTLAFGAAEFCDPLPVSLQIIKVVDDIVPGAIAVVTPGCVFEEKLTLMHTNSFAGNPENFYFEWLYLPPSMSPKPYPDGPDVNSPNDPWTPPPLSGASSGTGLCEITISGPGLLTLTDNWFAVRYKRADNSQPWGNRWSDWTPIQLAPGWLKRVVGEINPFTQRATGGGIEGAEEAFASYGSDSPNRIISMISQAGPRWDGDVPLSCETIDEFGLIPIYETVLGRGADLSINALSPVDNPDVNTALLLVASRVNDLYTLLGNEAYADAADPTIGFDANDDVYGEQATSIHAFMNQTASLLEEELALLRGRNDNLAPGVMVKPYYNRLVWNFSNDMTGGEVAYALNYDIRDQAEGDGVISEADAKRLYPQGHGDAWGHYLTAMTTYYKLLRHPYYTWTPRSETILVGGQPLTVDYLDERKFARTAAAKARAGSEIVNLAYRDAYTEDPGGQWQGYKDDDPEQAWGFSEWASRAGQGAFLDWVVGNAVMRAQDPNPYNEGVARVDRQTVPELREIATSYDDIEAQFDQADLGLNPLGLGTNVIPFDISPTEIEDGKTHFEQIYTRAVTAMNNAIAVFDRATNTTQLLRRQADSVASFERSVVDQEKDFNARLIEIFGYPYPEDIGPGKTYPTGYDGPDLYHYMYQDETGIDKDLQLQSVYFNNTAPATPDLENIPTIADSVLINSTGYVSDPRDVNIGDGDVTFAVMVRNYQTQANTLGHVDAASVTSGGVLPNEPIMVNYNMSFRNGAYGIHKPEGWTERRAPGEIQQAQAELFQAIASFMSAIDDYGGLMGNIEGQVKIVEQQYALSAGKIKLLGDRLDKKKTVQDVVFGLRIGLGVLKTAASIAEAIAGWVAESIPTVTGVIIGFSNGVIIDGLAPARGALGGAGVIISEALKAASTALEIAELRLAQQGERDDAQLTIDTTTLEGSFANLQAIKALETMLRSEVPTRIALHVQHQAVLQAVGNYQKTLAEGQRVVDRRELFRNQTAADIQSYRYKDMAFRIFRNDALQKYRAQFDLAARYVFLAAKAYDYETTMLSGDPLAGERFLTDIVKARQLGAVVDGLPQTGVGLANTMAVMGRNFEVLSTQLGFNNPQLETNRFSLRSEFLRTLPNEEGDPVWREVLARDYGTYGIGTAVNLWDVPEFRRFCVPPANFGDNEPGIIIPFSTTITEGKNFFGAELGGLDSSYDSTQFATKIRSVGIWFSNYDYLNLSNTPRVYLVPVGNDLLRSPTEFSGKPREFKVLDQVLPAPFPISVSELEDPAWIPSIDSLSGDLAAIRRFGRLRAYHDSGEFNLDEVQRDSRLVGRSVWNTKWMLIIPGSTLYSDSTEGIKRFIHGKLLDPATGIDGERDGNGVSDIKMFFETYAFPRLKK